MGMLDRRQAGTIGDPPHGMTAVGVFLCFGATMASFAAITLLWPGTFLDRAWVLNRHAREQLAPYRQIMGPVFLLLGIALLLAARGWWKRRVWGWRLTVIIIATQLVGDVVNLVRGDLLRGGFGVVVAGALLLYLLHENVRRQFHSAPRG